MGDVYLVAKSVSYFSPQKQSAAIPILKKIDFSVEKGSFVTIIGPSGSGKSTLLRLLNRLISPHAGTIEFQGTLVEKWNILELRRRIRMIFQTATMLPGTVYDNLTIVNRLPGASQIERSAVEQMLKVLSLPFDLLDRDAKQLSGGQQARIALGRALIDNPSVALFDEVTAALDQDTKKEIENYILHLHRVKGLTGLWVTHDLQQAQRMGEVTWVLANGEFVEAGPTNQLFQHPQHEITKRLLENTEGGSE